MILDNSTLFEVFIRFCDTEIFSIVKLELKIACSCVEFALKLNKSLDNIRAGFPKIFLANLRNFFCDTLMRHVSNFSLKIRYMISVRRMGMIFIGGEL